MIFRADADQGEIKEMDTPDEQTIDNEWQWWGCFEWKCFAWNRKFEGLYRKRLFVKDFPRGWLYKKWKSPQKFEGCDSPIKNRLWIGWGIIGNFLLPLEWKKRCIRITIRLCKAYPILQSSIRRTRLEPTSERFGIIPESSDPENASVPNGYDPEAMQSILCEMLVNSSAECHDTSNDGLSDSELNIVFCQAVNMYVLYNQLRSPFTNPRLSSKPLYLMPCTLLLYSNSTFNTEKVAEHSKRLSKSLLGYSLKLATVDYDCPASSIFISVLSWKKWWHLHPLYKSTWFSLEFHWQTVVT